MNEDTDLLQLFHAAADLPPDEQHAFIDSRCAGDDDLRRRLERLLSLDRDRTESFMRTPVGALTPEPTELTGQTLDGKYRVLRPLGEGGMGVVYLAEQERPKREVALKLVRAGLTTQRQLRRFELESELLARLSHPGIAQIYDVGNAGDEHAPRPYFAMEYIQGRTLLEHSRESGLTIEQRLELVAAICDAVQHAHQRGIIHRDLKPANILVDQSGRPKILDFGVARATDADIFATTMHTAEGQLIGTIAYMSPEQVLGSPNDIDTRSDVYALGVILYQLLADKLPFDLADKSIAAAAKTIAEVEPSSLSTVDRSLRGDLDTIVLKALEKDPQRRYQTAAALAADVRRSLSNEPIVARPATTMYQLRKFARRNRPLVAGVAAAFVVLVAGVAVSTTLAIGQTRALRESEIQRTTALAVNDFLTDDLIEFVDPSFESDRGITLLEALDRAVPRIEGRFSEAPLAEANLRQTIGRAYKNLHRLDAAEAQLSQAFQLYSTHRNEHDEDALLCRMELASILLQRTNFGAAEAEMQEILEIQRRVLGPDHVQTIASINNIGAALLSEGRFELARPYVEDALERRVRILGERNGHTASTMNNLAVLEVNLGQLDEAVELMSRTLDILRDVNGPDHPQTLQTAANLGMTYQRLGRFDEAVNALEDARASHVRVLGPRHRSTLLISGALAAVYGMAGENEKRESLLTETLAVQLEVLGEDHLDTLVTRNNLAKVSYDRQDHEVAVEEYASLAQSLQEHYPDHFLGAIVRSMLGSCLMELGRYPEAEAELTAAYGHMVRAVGETHPGPKEAASRLVDLYTRWEKPVEAGQWQSVLDGASPSG